MTRSPKILYAGTFERDYPRNQQMIRLLEQSGWNVVVVHEPFWERIRDKSRLGGVSSLLRLLARLLLVYARLVTRFLSQLRSADAVMIGYIGQIDMLSLAPVARLLGKPVIFNPLVTLTDTMVEDRALVKENSSLASVIRLVDRLSLRFATLIITDTEQNADYIHRTFSIERSRIGTVFVGADEEVFRNGYVGSGKTGLHVLFYGKMIPLHGIETILEAVSSLHSSGDTDISFVIIGSGQQEHLVREFVKANPEVSVTCRTWVAYPRLAQRIASADVTLGVFGEGEKAGRVIPNKVFQAMAVGAPIITRDSDAIRDVLNDEVSALLVPPGDSDALVAAIRQLQDPELRKRLGRGARSAFEQHGADSVTGAQLRQSLDRIGLNAGRDGVGV